FRCIGSSPTSASALAALRLSKAPIRYAARSWVARCSIRSTSCAYLRASSAYLVRSSSTESSASGALAIVVAVVGLQRGDLGREVRQSGRVLEDDDRAAARSVLPDR